jgi:hypothetical protein
MPQPLAGSPIAPELRPWVARAVRLGYAAKGIIYLLIGTLAFRLATGLDGGRLLDPSGALRIVLRQPFGELIVLVIGVGILAYSAWQFIDALWDTRRRGGGWGWWSRALSMIKGGAYGTVGWEAIRIVLGFRAQSQGPDGVAADVIRFPLGGVFLLLVGIGVAIYGGFEMREAWRAKFGDDLDGQRLRREVGAWALVVGRIGNGARAVILMIIGTALASAALDRDPSKASGIADALWTLITKPFGTLLLALVGAGLASFGLFQLLQSRYARL